MEITNNTQPLASVIIPAYNRSALLKKCIQSTIEQTYRPLEIIIVDDGSTEDLKSVAKSFLQDDGLKIIYEKQPNQGPGAARKKGLTLAKGKYIQYLDSDDFLLPQKLKKQIAALEKNHEAIMSYCGTSRYDFENSKELGIYNTSDIEHDRILPQLLISRPWATLSCLWRNDWTYENWVNVKNGQDTVYEFLRGLDNSPIIHIPEVLCVVNEHDQGHHRNKIPLTDDTLGSSYKTLSVMYDALQKVKSSKNFKATKEILAERMFVTGLRLYRIGMKEKSMELLEKSKKLAPGYFLKSVVIAKIGLWFDNIFKRDMVRLVYALHRRFNPSLKFPHRSV